MTWGYEEKLESVLVFYSTLYQIFYLTAAINVFQNRVHDRRNVVVGLQYLNKRAFGVHNST